MINGTVLSDPIRVNNDNVKVIKGERGVTFTPHIDASKNLSWTNDGGLVNPPTINLSAGTVDPTVVAEAVEEYLEEHPIETLTPEDVEEIVAAYVTDHHDELKGDKGDTGERGADGYTPVKGVDYFTSADVSEIVTQVVNTLPKYNGEVIA